MRACAGYPCNGDDITTAAAAGYFEAAGRHTPTMIKLLQHLREHEGSLPDDPAVLRAISVPVLVLHGTKTAQPHQHPRDSPIDDAVHLELGRRKATAVVRSHRGAQGRLGQHISTAIALGLEAMRDRCDQPGSRPLSRRQRSPGNGHGR